jgi:hypothetical protein
LTIHDTHTRVRTFTIHDTHTRVRTFTIHDTHTRVRTLFSSTICVKRTRVRTLFSLTIHDTHTRVRTLFSLTIYDKRTIVRTSSLAKVLVWFLSLLFAGFLTFGFFGTANCPFLGLCGKKHFHYFIQFCFFKCQIAVRALLHVHYFQTFHLGLTSLCDSKQTNKLASSHYDKSDSHSIHLLLFYWQDLVHSNTSQTTK